MVRRRVRSKGVDVLLYALRLLLDRGITSWNLQILGDGPLRSEYEQLTQALGLEDHVRFPGYLPNPYPWMASADVFVHPARWEGFGMVIVEAVGLVYLLWRRVVQGGPKDILANGQYRILVPPEDPVALANAMEDLILDESKRENFGKLARRRVKFYHPEHITEIVLEIEEYICFY